MSKLRSSVWLVEDDVELADTLAFFLIEHFDLQLFSSADQCLEKLEDTSGYPDVVITDIRMPGTSGLLLVEKLLKRKVKLPVVVITGSLNSGGDPSLQNRKDVALLLKPFKPEELVSLVKKQLRRTNFWGDLEA